MIKALPPLQKNEEFVQYDVDSWFTNILLKETIDYIIHKIYNEEIHKPYCTIQFNQCLYKQIDGCAMGDPLSVILADIHM